MSTRIALIGAGGKMGCRLTDNFLKCSYLVDYVEVGPRGLENLKARGVRVVAEDQAVEAADVVILAVPDVAMGEIAERVLRRMRPGSLLITLDPAAPLDGQIPHRDDVACVVAHPCHPSVFNWEPTEQAFRDFYGGISAKQAIICALMRGGEPHYELGVAIARDMYAPVSRVHRVSLEQMAMLEPALVETLAQTCMEAVKEGCDRVVAAGVPAEAVRDFALGHLRIQIAVLFGEVDGTFSDAAYKITRRARSVLFRDNWQRIFELSDIRDQVRDITTR
ncbi:MAG: semialdehyde dehydrogenase [Luteitalea sp.]|nr:semialdehyde dehydrogenase [Luteitalea sp.]